MVARSLVDPSQGYIVLRVVNTTNFEKIIRENTCLAECQADANFGESIGKQETVNIRLCVSLQARLPVKLEVMFYQTIYLTCIPQAENYCLRHKNYNIKDYYRDIAMPLQSQRMT